MRNRDDLMQDAYCDRCGRFVDHAVAATASCHARIGSDDWWTFGSALDTLVDITCRQVALLGLDPRTDDDLISHIDGIWAWAPTDWTLTAEQAAEELARCRARQQQALAATA